MTLSKNETKSLIMARYGMLQCGRNYRGTMSQTCSLCNVIDDEEHRLNRCPKYVDMNFYRAETYVAFETIFSGDVQKIRQILSRIEKVWNVKTGHGLMNTG